MLSDKEKKVLLQIARKSIEEYLRTGKEFSPRVKEPVLLEKRGVFVTLTLQGKLRGCIGCLEVQEELARATSRLALEAALSDPRFLPVGEKELPQLKIEISVLSVPQKVSNIQEIELGRDGVILTQSGRKGVFLPQVARETGWSKEEFLMHLAQDKAGLSPRAYQEKDAELFTFQAEIFSEAQNEPERKRGKT